ncbi:hypothetical protein EDB87DRAFT_1315996 [Lactarius vividus]|nr:hypothetical protein EDB87DRAFT_1315996 [Lactarius vividus]
MVSMLAGGEPTKHRASQLPRFSHYLHFAWRRHRHRIEEQDPADARSQPGPEPGALVTGSSRLDTRYNHVCVRVFLSRPRFALYLTSILHTLRSRATLTLYAHLVPGPVSALFFNICKPGGFVPPEVRAVVASARTTLGLGLICNSPASIYGPAPLGLVCSCSFWCILPASLRYLLQIRKAAQAAMMHMYCYYDFTLSKVPAHFSFRLKDDL